MNVPWRWALAGGEVSQQVRNQTQALSVINKHDPGQNQRTFPVNQGPVKVLIGVFTLIGCLSEGNVGGGIMIVFMFNIAPFTSWLSLSLFMYVANRATNVLWVQWLINAWKLHLAFLHCFKVNKGAFPKVQNLFSFYSYPSTSILSPRWLQGPETGFPMELLESGIISCKPIERSWVLKDSPSFINMY